MSGMLLSTVLKKTCRIGIVCLVNTLSLWIAGDLLVGIEFFSLRSLFLSGALVGLVNIFIKPTLIVLTLPLTIFSLGLSILVINGLMLMSIGWLVDGFSVSGFWVGLQASIIISICNFIVNSLLSTIEVNGSKG